MSKHLSPQEWEGIRAFWEHSPMRVSYAQAAELAGRKHGFAPPSKQRVAVRASADGWERKVNAADINRVAHLIADRVSETGAETILTKDDPKTGPALTVVGRTAESIPKVDASRQKKEPPPEAYDVGSGLAEVTRKWAEHRVRHRQEWLQVAQLKQEALALRKSDPGECFHRLKIAKITAEATEIQQRGECKAWGMDEVIDPARLKEMTEVELEAFIAGRY